MASPAPDLEEYRQGVEALLAAPGPEADERLARLFTADALAGLRARGATALGRFAAEGLLRRASAAEMAEVRARLAEPVVEAPGGLLALSAVDAALAAEPGREARRAIQDGRLRAIENRLGPLLADTRARREEAARDAGAASPEALLAGAAGLDLAAVAAAGEGLLDATDGVVGPALAVAAAAALGDGEAPEAGDLPRVVRAPQLEHEVSSGAARDVAARTLELLELDLPGGPAVAAGGREGLALWLETLAALGARLAAAGASPRLPAEARLLADPALARASGLLLEGLAADPAWLARAAGVREVEAAAGAAGTARLLAARAAAARAVGLAGAGAAPTSRALGVDWPAALSLADGLAGLGPADELRALALSAALRAHLRERHGARWFADPRAGRLLRELWLEGGALDPEALARELGAPGLDPGPLAAELSAAAGP